MIWTSTTAVVTTQVVPPIRLISQRPDLGSLIAELGLLRGVLRHIEDWREYPPHGPLAISRAPHHSVEASPVDSPSI